MSYLTEDVLCKGCVAYKSEIECILTKTGIKHIPKCPCKLCLVKILCEKVCTDLRKTLNNNKELR